MNKQVVNRWYYSFSVQLFIMHIKKNQILVLYWLLLFGFITRTFANKFGIPYLFLDPEYMGKVNGRSFLIMGLATGAFIMAFNISSFLLNSFRFPFLASLNKTFQKYTLNNFILPLSFILLYCGCIFRFQYISQLKPITEILLNIFCFLAGIAAIVYSTWKYFLITNKDIYKLFGIEHAESDATEIIHSSRKPNGRKRKQNYGSRNWRVETYLSIPLKTKLVRDTSHYKHYMLQSVLKQNHVNAAVVEIIIFITFIILGLFRDYPLFKIPAGASILLLFTMIIMLSGVFRFWLRAWANSAIVIVFLLLNFLSKFESFNPSNKAYGLDYGSSKPVYNLKTIEASLDSSTVAHDKLLALQALNNWQAKWEENGISKPKMILLNVSGGGVRSALFTFQSMLAIDSVLNGRLMMHTKLITGSSGGLMGASYYRALYSERMLPVQPQDNHEHLKFTRNISKDLLNAVAFSFTVSDLFLNMQGFSDGKYRYVKDRAYAFEKQFNDNTNFILDKRIGDYRDSELQGNIPMMVIAPTIINDGRSVLISSLPVSYLLQHKENSQNLFKSVPDGIEFTHFFKDQDALNLRFTSALRLNATFPYIMPSATLPSEPPIEVMDAGIRDNYGITTSLRFLFTFREWISRNTSGVIIVQVRDNYKRIFQEDASRNTFFEKMVSPLKNLTGNFILMQDYINDNSLTYARAWFDGPLDFIQMEMPEMEDKISLSWHLTEKEKVFILNSVYKKENLSALKTLKKISTAMPAGKSSRATKFLTYR